jgi:uncharacterized membrane protein
MVLIYLNLYDKKIIIIKDEGIIYDFDSSIVTRNFTLKINK